MSEFNNGDNEFNRIGRAGGEFNNRPPPVAAPVGSGFLQMETADFLLMETSDKILLD